MRIYAESNPARLSLSHYSPKEPGLDSGDTYYHFWHYLNISIYANPFSFRPRFRRDTVCTEILFGPFAFYKD